MRESTHCTGGTDEAAHVFDNADYVNPGFSTERHFSQNIVHRDRLRSGHYDGTVALYVSVIIGGNAKDYLPISLDRLSTTCKIIY